MTQSDQARLDAQLQRLQLHYIQDHYQEPWPPKPPSSSSRHLDYLAQLVEGEAAMRESRSIERRIRNARFPVLKTLDDFQWSWPKKINRPQIQNLFRLAFIATQTNIVLIGNVGLGKTHLADRPRPRRLSERTLRALHHRRRHHQHPGRRPVRRPPQARVPALPEARRAYHRRTRLSCPSTSMAPTCCSRSSASATSGRRW